VQRIAGRPATPPHAAAVVLAAAVAVVLVMAGCRARPEPSPAAAPAVDGGRTPAGRLGDESPDAWLAPVARDHALVGRIWDVAARRAVAPATLFERAAEAQVVLLGEKHDNPDHHRLQARLLASLAARGRRPVVAFEMIAADRRADLARVLAGPAPSVAEVRAAIDDGRGWDWALYVPILETALRWRLPIVAADLDAATLAALRTSGLGGLTPDAIARLGLDRVVLSSADRRALAAEIRAAHCGMAPKAMVDRLVAIQRARDARLARALVDAGVGNGGAAVLIAGAGHVRRDRGVPRYLAAWTPGAATVSVALLEVEVDHDDPADTLAALFGSAVPFDYVWFTPRVDALDPCTKFHRQLERMTAPPHARRGGVAVPMAPAPAADGGLARPLPAPASPSR
jgi:uncharacterized iron-regulated protein